MTAWNLSRVYKPTSDVFHPCAIQRDPARDCVDENLCVGLLTIYIFLLFSLVDSVFFLVALMAESEGKQEVYL